MSLDPLQLDIEKVAFVTNPDRGFVARASYLKPPHNSDALIEIIRDGQTIRKFLFPAYKIYNIAAHLGDIVDGELEGNDSGYKAAAWTGF